MFEMLKKAFAADPISKDDAYALIKEFTALLETRIKKTERELHLQLTILSKRIDALEFDLNGGKRPAKVKKSPIVKRGRPRVMAPAAKITKTKV